MKHIKKQGETVRNKETKNNDTQEQTKYTY